MAQVLAVVNDLMLSSRVVETLKAAGHDVTLVARLPESAADGTALLVCDLDAVDATTAMSLGLPALGFYSHTDVGTRTLALDAGFDIVVPRSRMVRELPALAESLIDS